VTGRRVAVIGGGVSGITAGYILSREHHVTLFEAGTRLGGHADTHLVVPPAGPPLGVDTGFIVYNERTYSLLTRLFAELGVATQPAPMSMSVRGAGCGLQYAGRRGPAGVAAGLRRGRGRYPRMLAEIPRFHRAARRLLADGADGPDFGHPDHRRGAEVRDAAGQRHRFDAVVIATHPDQALRLLHPATPAERDVLGAFGYTRNPATLHTDVTLLPARPGIRASWNYELGHCDPEHAAPRIHYHLNRLQSLPAGEDCIVTLGGAVDPRRVIDRMDYAHPVYTPASVAAQRRLPGLNTGVTAFAGAYHGWGFHEDGCRSGAEAARALGGTW
jgi:predicted NAD/FAD-binding protein